VETSTVEARSLKEPVGFLPVPQLMYCREEFPEAVKWQTKTRNGCVDIYDNGKILSPQERMQYIKKNLHHNR